MMRRATLALLCCLVPASTFAATSLDIGAVAGLYVHRHATRVLNRVWEDAAAEDVLEIVKVSGREAYVRARLEFENGHVCSFYGVAVVEGDRLVYRKPATDRIFAGPGKPLQRVESECVLTLRRDRDRIVFGDQGDICGNSMCGARGMWRDARFELKARRTITYMPRLLASRQYAEALRERKAK